MRRLLPVILAIACAFFGLGLVCAHRALADGSGSAISDAGSGSSASAPSPSSQLHDPTTDPMGAISDAKDAKSKGWPFLVLVILIFVTKVASYAGGKFAPLGKFLATGKNAMIIAGVGTVLAACLNTLANGGNWYAVVVAASVAGFALISSHAPATAVEKHSA